MYLYLFNEAISIGLMLILSDKMTTQGSSQALKRNNPDAEACIYAYIRFLYCTHNNTYYAIYKKYLAYN